MFPQKCVGSSRGTKGGNQVDRNGLVAITTIAVSQCDHDEYIISRRAPDRVAKLPTFHGCLHLWNWGMSMNNPEDCRDRALGCIEMANEALDTRVQSILFDIARSYAKLARVLEGGREHQMGALESAAALNCARWADSVLVKLKRTLSF
jgi:hypothetical protein